MAFMMPIVKNDYNVYPSCPSSRAGNGTKSRDSILSSCSSSRAGSGTQSRDSNLSSSPGAASLVGSPRHSQTPALRNMPKSGSQSSLHKFHCKLLDKLKKTFRGKDDPSDDVHQPSESSSMSVTLR